MKTIWRFFVLLDGFTVTIERHPVDKFSHADNMWERILCHCPTYERAVDAAETFYRNNRHDLERAHSNFRRFETKTKVMENAKDKYK